MSFDVISPKNLEEGLFYLAKYRNEISPLAGGTNFMVDIKKRKIKPPKVLDLSNLTELKDISTKDNFITIGSLVTHAQLEASPLFTTGPLRMLSQGAELIGGPAIRNVGTIGGNIQNASPAADVVVPLLALDAKVELASLDKKREVFLEDFFVQPGQTIKKPEELITEVSFQIPEDGRSIFTKLGQRNALAIAIVSLAIYLKLNSDKEISKIAIAFGSVAPTVVRARECEEYFLGKKINEETDYPVQELIFQDIKPIKDIRASSKYRQAMSYELLVRGLRALTANCRRSLS